MDMELWASQESITVHTSYHTLRFGEYGPKAEKQISVIHAITKDASTQSICFLALRKITL